ncbi:hypothetical protein E2C01_086840 [Portunus trituberculatus]|uniref:Uncharacterized protein n=1 Tax=Portunus trituberculatus TaxID=210409 RepID=A0A5B7J6F6_PORTR|nr:hypothetical protein [Portunus trituberculatus]
MLYLCSHLPQHLSTTSLRSRPRRKHCHRHRSRDGREGQRRASLPTNHGLAAADQEEAAEDDPWLARGMESGSSMTPDSDFPAPSGLLDIATRKNRL